MKHPKHTRSSRSRLLASVTTLCLLLLPATSPAQVAAPDSAAPAQPKASAEKSAPLPVATTTSRDDVVELSPFTVDASQDHGYESGNTLSGTRLNTPSKYVGSSVFEVTKELMNDLSLTNMQDLIDFAPNSSSYNGGGINQDPNGNNALFGTNYNVRGLLVSSMTRDFINTRAADDAYNIEQFSFTRGPNSILFGIGNPGGITNSVSKRAKMIDSYQVSLRADNFDSTRATFDANKVILKDQLAIRIAGLTENAYTNRKPSDRKADRLYGTITYKPFKNTTIRANAETGKIDQLNVRPWAAADGLSAWLAAGSKDIPPGMEAGGATYANVAANPSGQPTVSVNTALVNAAGYEIQNPNPQLLLVQNSASPIAALTQQGFITTGRPALPGGDRTPTLVNSPIPYTANVLGYGNRLTQDISNYSLFLEQKIGQNFYIEAVFNHQKTDNWNNYSAGNQDNIYLDKQKTLLTWDNQVIANPNYDRYFISNITETSYLSNYIDQTERVMGAYTLDLRKKVPGVWGKILGHHNFAALGEKVSSDYTQAFAFLVNTTPELVTSTPRFPAAAKTNIQNSLNRIGSISYLTIGDDSTYPMRNLLADYPAIIFDGSPLPAANANGITPAFVANTSTRSIQEIKSKLFVAQDFFWDDKIVTTVGIRHDDSSLWLLPSAQNAGNRNYVFDARNRDVKSSVTSIDRSGNTYTQGIVVTPLPWLGVFYNRASSFIPPAAQVDIYGAPLPNGDGKGQDYGFKISLLDGKLSASISKYTTDYNNVPGTVLRSGATNLSGVRLAVAGAMNNTAIGGPGGPMWDGSDPRWAASSVVTSNINDVNSEGYEFSATANPTPNWRIMVNFATQETQTSNYGARETQWVDEVAYGYFNAHPEYLGLLTGAGLQNSNETIAQRLQDMRTVLSLAQSLSGKADARQSKYSANLVTGYDFTHGKLKGLGVGATYKWRQKPILGYAYVTGRTDLFDTSKVFYGEDTNTVGAFAYYRFKAWKTSGRVQLNVDGITSDEDLHPYSAVDDGTGHARISRYSVGPGTRYSLTTTFDF